MMRFPTWESSTEKKIATRPTLLFLSCGAEGNAERKTEISELNDCRLLCDSLSGECQTRPIEMLSRQPQVPWLLKTQLELLAVCHLANHGTGLAAQWRALDQ
jgi:hypothetical protein